LDKRLLIVLPLCLVIVIGWNLFMAKVHPPPPRVQAPRVTQPANTPATPSPAQPAPEAQPSASVIGAVLRAEKEEQRTFRIGQPGEKGSYELDFTNRGGALKELHLGDYFDKAALNETERADSKHWTRLVTQL